MDPAMRRWFFGGLALVVLIAVGLAQWSSSEPDGLERVAADVGLADQADESAAGGPLADYGESLPGPRPVGTAVAGLIGVVATLGLGYGLLRWSVARAGRESPAGSGTDGE